MGADFQNYQPPTTTANMGFLESLGNNILGALGLNTTAEWNYNSNEAWLNRNFQSKEAQKQRAWEEEMSNTAYQRAVKDMQAAGINPAQVFASSGGSAAASTPSGASAHGSAASYKSTPSVGGIASLINSSANLARSFNTDKNTANDMNKKQMVDTVIKLAKLMK